MDTDLAVPPLELAYSIISIFVNNLPSLIPDHHLQQNDNDYHQDDYHSLQLTASPQLIHAI